MFTRKIPMKNYIFAAIIIIVSVVLTFYILAWYKTIKDYRSNNSVIIEAVNKIDVDSIPNYLVDNSNIVLYLASSSDSSIKNFESKFKKLILEENLNSNIVYFDIANLSDEEIDNIFLQYTNPKLNLKKIVTPNLLYFEDGELVRTLYTKKNSVKKEDVIKFLEGLGYIEND